MKFSPAIKWCLVLLLPLTLGWKLAVALRTDDPAERAVAIVEFLTGHQFNAVSKDETRGGLQIVEASSNECHLLVARISPLGDSADQVQSLASQDRSDNYRISWLGFIISSRRC